MLPALENLKFIIINLTIASHNRQINFCDEANIGLSVRVIRAASYFKGVNAAFKISIVGA